MDDKALRKLSRMELLEMLLEESKENERLRAQIKKLTEQLNDRQIQIDDSGSIAEAALKLNGVFDAAQRAAQQYLDNLERMTTETETKCRLMEAETKKRCIAMVRAAKKGERQ